MFTCYERGRKALRAVEEASVRVVHCGGGDERPQAHTQPPANAAQTVTAIILKVNLQ